MNNDESKLSSIGKLSLVVLFWLFLLVECFALFTNRLWLYGVARSAIVPLMFFRVFSERGKGEIGALFFMALLFSIIADGLTLYGNSLFMGYVGLSMYSISYVGLASFIMHKASILDVRYIILVMGIIVFCGVDILWINIPRSRDTIFYVQIGLHVAVLLFLLISTIYLFIQIKNVSYPFIFLIAIVFVISANSLYGISLLRYDIHNHFLNMLVGFSHGLYIYLYANGAIRTIKESDQFD